MIMTRRTVLLGGLYTMASGAFAADKCPGVDAVRGTQPPLSSAAVVPVLPLVREVPEAWKKIAMEIIALFEAGVRNPDAAYRNVSTTDQISLGYLQWNHNSGSLYAKLLSDATPAIIDAAPATIKEDIATLANPKLFSKKKAETIIAGWKNGNGSLLQVKRIALETWLSSPPMIERQSQLLDAQLKIALQISDAWQRDFGFPLDSDGEQRAFYSFVDMKIFNGDLHGLWVPHVKTFRSGFKSGLEMMDFIAGWVNSCVSYRFKGDVLPPHNKSYTPEYHQLYRHKETPLSVADWRALVAARDPRTNDAVLNLIALGYLRALVSNGNDRPKGFHGVFELDVLNRRGMMATGRGVLSDETHVTEIYRL